jgi:hypothetical protein
MNYEEAFPSRFLRGIDIDIDGELTLTVEKVSTEIIDKVKLLLSFERQAKQVVCNRTNAEAMKLMFGPETDEWVGKRVTLFAPRLPNHFEGHPTPQIRIRGSPDIKAPLRASITRGSGARKKIILVEVIPTGTATGTAKASAKSNPPARSDDPITPDVAKIAAWSAFKSAHPAAPRSEGEKYVAEEFGRVVDDMFPNRSRDLTVEEWDRVRLDGPRRFTAM